MSEKSKLSMLPQNHETGTKIQEAESKFSAFEGYEAIPQEEINGLVQTIIGSVDEEAIRETVTDATLLGLPPYWRDLTDDDVQGWVKQNFVKKQFQPIYKNKMRMLKEKAKDGDKTAILLMSMFGEGGSLNHYDIVDRWAHVKEVTKERLVKWKQDIKGEYGTVTPDDWDGELQDKVSGLVREVNEKIQSIKGKLDDDDLPMRQEFEAYVQSLRDKRKAVREKYLADQNVDKKVLDKLGKIEQRIRHNIEKLAEWQRAISDFHKEKKDRFRPEAITIPNYRSKDVIYPDSGKRFSGQVRVDEETGDLTLDFAKTGNIFTGPLEFVGLIQDELNARMEFKAKELHADGKEEEYVISLGFDDDYGSYPYLQFICSETRRVSEKIRFGTDHRLDMTMMVKKPVIYLYSDRNIDAEVRVNYKGEFTTVYPNFTGDSEWAVKTLENGLIECQNRTYPYLFWEGIPNSAFDTDFDEGFCIKRNELKEFLEDKLAILGLNSKEQTDFITYWLPVLERNEFNLIQFCIKEYEEKAKLLVNPKPDQLVRVFMRFKAIDNYVKTKEQQLTKVERNDNGFVVVEWGGVNLGRY